jgi:hypothetical protein
MNCGQLSMYPSYFYPLSFIPFPLDNRRQRRACGGPSDYTYGGSI